MKLLSKSLRSYLVFSSLLLLVTIPVFYFVVRAVLLNSVDKSLRQQLSDIRKNLPNIRTANELEIWSSMDKDIRLGKTPRDFADSISTIYLPDEEEQERDPFRQISAAIPLNGQYYSLSITSSLVENDDLLGSIVAVETVFLILLLLGMLWINRSISKRLWHPFYRTLSGLREYELSKHEMVAFPPEEIDEFRQLNEGLENLLNKNHEIYLAQKDFTGSAAHEMQTPLAVFQGQLELLMQTQPLTAEQAGVIQDLDMNNQRLIRTNRSLLQLAKVENESFTHTVRIDLSVLMTETLAAYLPAMERRQIKLEKQFAPEAFAEGNRTLTEMLAANLLSNAVRHNFEKGTVRLETLPGKLIVKNTGIGAALDTSRMYQRFYKSGPSREGIGLGLSIVKRICDVSRMQIGYHYSDGWHVFTVHFPA